MTSSSSPPRVAVFAKPHRDAAAVLRRTVACLQRNGAEIVLDRDAAHALGVECWSERPAAVEGAVLVISVGGDGTLLSAARAVGARETPILGVNLGNLGFLTETRTEDVDRAIELALGGRALIEPRRALSVRRDAGSQAVHEIALNDLVISQSLQRLFSVALYVDNEWVGNYRADGLILATPTGSTAYSLSAGGPVVVPTVDALVITPICPHSLSQRPIILHGDAKVTFAIADGERHTGVQVALDGQSFFALEPGEKLTVLRSEHPVHLIRPPGRTFFTTLREKLGWGH